jgi:hypothetical protein
VTPRLGLDRLEGREPPRHAPRGEPAVAEAEAQRRPAVSGTASPADVLGLQRLAGNRAVVRLLARDGPFTSPPPAPPRSAGDAESKAAEDAESKAAEEKKDEAPPPWFPHGQPPGVAVKGYEHPRSQYSDEDKTHLTNALAERRRENIHVAVQLMGDYASSFINLWGRSVAHMMAKASVREQFSLFKVFVELHKITSEVMKEGAHWLAHKTAAYVAKVAVDYGAEKLEDVDEEVEETKEKADRLSKVLSDTIPGLFEEIEKELEQPYEWYARYISEGDLTKFRIPELLPKVPKQDVEAAVAGTIVAALHESHQHSNVYRGDPTEHQPVSYFDDNLVISHVVLGPGHTVEHLVDAEIYTPVPILLQALVGRSVREMPHVPVIVVVDTSLGRDLDAARELMAAFRSVGDPDRESDEESRAAEVNAFLDAYPDPVKELLLERYPRPEGPKRDDEAAEAAQWESMPVSASGGGLAEHLWLYRWAHGDDLSILVRPILNDEGLDAPTPQRLAQLTYERLNGWLRDGAEQFFAGYAPKMKVSRPENRWDFDYWKPGLRWRFYRYGSRHEWIQDQPGSGHIANTLPPR